MKVSLNWLREFVELPASVDSLTELLTLAGIEVEKVERRGSALPKVVVAQIRDSAQHPNADRLSVCNVDDGSGSLHQIVCGAKNYKSGDKVLLALPGAVLPGDFKIKVGKLRGVESHGMMCSARELQLGDDSEGLLILPPETPLGTPIHKVFPDDTILDLEVTPNRPDLLSVLGVGREIAALSRRALVLPQLRVTEPVAACRNVEIATADCRFYSARKIDGVRIASSPTWLVQRLEAVGLHAINNVVDITNFVMMEMGQPLHAFDAGKLRGGLQVRAARDAEKFAALDGNHYTLAEGDIIIADEDAPVAIGGVMGGEASAVTGTTTAVWLEAADFKPQNVRRVSRRLGLVTESSYRFERGVDSQAVLYASQRATELILELAGGVADAPLRFGYPASLGETSATGAKVSIFFPALAASTSRPADNNIAGIVVPPLGKGAGPLVDLRPSRVASLLGRPISEDEIDQILRRLGLHREGSKWRVPSFRIPDLAREVDLIEEIARLIGMETIPAKCEGYFAPASLTDRRHDRAMSVRRGCVAQGLHEARSMTLVPENGWARLAPRGTTPSVHRVKNPMNDDQVILRPNLLHGLLGAVRTNVHAGEKSVRLFELGRVYSAAQAEESTHLGIVLSGPPGNHSWRPSAKADADIFTLKGIVGALFDCDVAFARDDSRSLSLALRITMCDEVIGFAGQISPEEARAVDATAPIVFAEIDLSTVEKTEGNGLKRYRAIARFPAMTRDIAILAPLTLEHSRIVSVLDAAREPLLTSVELFDVFNDPGGEKLPADKKSLAYSLTYRAPDRTLTADEVNAAHMRLKERLKSELGVALRE